MLSENTARMGDKAKPSGARKRRRLCCFEQVAQYKIIKIKFVASLIAVTLLQRALRLLSLRRDHQTARSSLANDRLKN
jgi:hypothetical protein